MSVQKHAAALEHWLAPVFEKTPHLPHNARQTLASIAPWLALIFGILGLIGIISMGGIGMILSFHMYWGGSAFPFLIAMLIGLVTSILDLLAFKPLRDMRKRGWNLIFYGILLSALSTVLNIFFMGDVSLGGILGVLLSLWLLFEVRGIYR